MDARGDRIRWNLNLVCARAQLGGLTSDSGFIGWLNNNLNAPREGAPRLGVTAEPASKALNRLPEDAQGRSIRIGVVAIAESSLPSRNAAFCEQFETSTAHDTLIEVLRVAIRNLEQSGASWASKLTRRYPRAKANLLTPKPGDREFAMYYAPESGESGQCPRSYRTSLALILDGCEDEVPDDLTPEEMADFERALTEEMNGLWLGSFGLSRRSYQVTSTGPVEHTLPLTFSATPNLRMLVPESEKSPPPRPTDWKARKSYSRDVKRWQERMAKREAELEAAAKLECADFARPEVAAEEARWLTRWISEQEQRYSVWRDAACVMKAADLEPKSNPRIEPCLLPRRLGLRCTGVIDPADHAYIYRTLLSMHFARDVRNATRPQNPTEADNFFVRVRVEPGSASGDSVSTRTSFTIDVSASVTTARDGLPLATKKACRGYEDTNYLELVRWLELSRQTLVDEDPSLSVAQCIVVPVTNPRNGK